jgi:hypothetical protein
MMLQLPQHHHHLRQQQERIMGLVRLCTKKKLKKGVDAVKE